MGDLFSAKANSDGKFKGWFVDNYLQMYEYDSINGNSVSVHFPMFNQLDYDEDDIKYRLSSLGVIGININDWVPHQDLGPWPCSDYVGLPHGGRDLELCDIYNDINMHHPEIAKFVYERKFDTVFD